MRRTLLVLSFALASVAHAQRGGAGRPRVCTFDWFATSDSTHQTISQTQTKKIITWWGGGVRGVCRGTTMRLYGDSLEYSEDAGLATLIGNTRYTEDSTTITANLMRYNINSAQVFAEGAVKVRMKNGTTLDSDLFQYLRPQLPARNYSAADASGNVLLVMRDSVNTPDSLITTITSQRLHMLRDSLFYAAASVVITRRDIIATADSAETNSRSQNARLTGAKPQIKGRGNRTFTINGNLLDIFGREQQIERLIARGKAVAVSDSMELSADTLDIRTTGTTIDRIDTRSAGSRSRAVSPGQDISAIRLEISMPGQKLQDLRAYGKARAETSPDSTVVTTERNWIEGDTLTALFEQSVSKEQSGQPAMRSLIAVGSARSFFQSKSKNTSCKEPTLSYVTGKKIDVVFKTGRVDDVEIHGTVRGINANPCNAVTDSVPPRRGGSR